MSRYRGPRVKLMRALGLNLPGLSRKSIERRPYPPGAHGGDRRRKESDYGRQLKEKQKLRFNYGLGERQLRRLVIDARRSKTETGKKLLELLESRLDNVVFRGGLASTIPAARQLVNHAHVLVNGQKVDIPSFRVKVGDVITVRERSRKLQSIKDALESPALQKPDWLSVTPAEMKIAVDRSPDDSSVPFPIEVQLVVEYYARMI
ncbi:MAG: 30S ribosomal protein S4 [Myxococcales bacterium]|nr:30S ribosomal protein S4 [Myxococcales bacterium]MCB9549783.1 30S ribosomal protein S4 [Myxococcales bacterium]